MVMVTGRPLIGVNVSTSVGPDADPVGEAKHAEELGFDFVSSSDHLHGTRPSFETWTLLTWVAASTSRIGIATDVLGMPYRPPAVLAKMAESLDRLSGGRLILGLGGGGSDEEFRAFGLGERTPREKVEGLEEAMVILRGLWSERSFSFRGSRYHVDRAELEPKPDRRIPVWTGSYGTRSLEITGRLADGWIPSYPLLPPEVARGKLARVRAAADRAGRDPDDIIYAYNVGVRVDERAEPRPRVVVGGPEQVTERLAGLLDLGFTCLNLWPAGPDKAGQGERLAREVVPALRSRLV
jgi:alkanesulfonate monooxygenase SsuD/methylene tetrahydromethanopterin reductase-like flavin-dependent oxidoreductase (luciferase family)